MPEVTGILVETVAERKSAPTPPPTDTELTLRCAVAAGAGPPY